MSEAIWEVLRQISSSFWTCLTLVLLCAIFAAMIYVSLT